MTFDPFGDFATQGYLRNVEKEKDLDIVKRLEHASFTTGLDEAFTALGKASELAYPDLLQTHRILFNAVYPWAGQDRLVAAPGLTVRKGAVIFANPSEIQPAAEFALRKGKKGVTFERIPARSWAILPSPIHFSTVTGGR